MPDWTNMDSYGFPVLSKTHYITCSTSRSGRLYHHSLTRPIVRVYAGLSGIAYHLSFPFITVISLYSCCRNVVVHIFCCNLLIIDSSTESFSFGCFLLRKDRQNLPRDHRTRPCSSHHLRLRRCPVLSQSACAPLLTG